jgi:predicted RNase H-like HicB family nuclease
MPGIIQINIYKEKNYYHASGLNVPIVTQGKNFEELTKNIKEAVKLYLDFKRSEKTVDKKKNTPAILLSCELQTDLCLG